MKVEQLLTRLIAAGVKTDAPELLDALWLATHIRRVRKRAIGARAPEPTLPVPSRSLERRSTEPSSTAGNTRPPSPDSIESGGERTVFPNAFKQNAMDQRAAPVQVHSPSARVDCLAFSKTFRPFRTPWRKGLPTQLDEDATAELVARRALAGSMVVTPVLRASPERWFDVELVLEDDQAMELWRDEHRALIATIRSTGAFRRLRYWTLEIEAEVPRLRSSSGERIKVCAIGGERSLVLFLTHGASPRWLSGILDGALSEWSSRSPTAIIQMLPRRWWSRTALGEPNAYCISDETGIATRRARMLPAWWLDPVRTDATAVPMLSFDAPSFQQWARMVMSRGGGVPARVLGQISTQPIKEGDLTDQVELRLGGLRESEPRAFALAVALSTIPFTIPVARIVEEAHLGTRETSSLAALFLSGLLEPAVTQRGEAGSWFRIQPTASALLQRSIRRSDRRRVAEALVTRVSEHIAKATGRAPDITSFVPNESGAFTLPDWAQPYARLASGLRETTYRAPNDREVLIRLRERLPRDSFGCFMRDVAHSREIVRTRYPDLWDVLLDHNILASTQEGRRLSDEATAVLREWNKLSPLWGVRVLWVDDLPTNNDTYRPILLGEGAEVVDTRSTIEALRLDVTNFDLIISDMARNEGPREGLVLLEALSHRKDTPPVVIFSGKYASNARNRARALRYGALECTNVFDIVYDRLLEVVRSDRQPGLVARRVPASEPEAQQYIGRQDWALVMDLDEGRSRTSTAGVWAFATMLRGTCGVPAERIAVLRDVSTMKASFDIAQGLSDIVMDRSKSNGRCFVYLCGGFDQGWGKSIDLEIVRVLDQLYAHGNGRQLVVIADLAERFGGRRNLNVNFFVRRRRMDLDVAQFVAIARTFSSAAFQAQSEQYATSIPIFTREVIKFFEERAAMGEQIFTDDLTHALSKRLSRNEVSVEYSRDNSIFIDVSDKSSIFSALRPWWQCRDKALSHARDGNPNVALEHIRAARIIAPDSLEKQIVDELLLIEVGILCRLSLFEEAIVLVLDSDIIDKQGKFRSDATFYLALAETALGRHDQAISRLFDARDDVTLRAAVGRHRLVHFKPLIISAAFQDYIAEDIESDGWSNVASSHVQIAWGDQLSKRSENKLRRLVDSFHDAVRQRRMMRIVLEYKSGNYGRDYLRRHNHTLELVREKVFELGVLPSLFKVRSTGRYITIKSNGSDKSFIELNLQEQLRGILLIDE